MLYQAATVGLGGRYRLATVAELCHSSRTPSKCPASPALANHAGLSAYHLHRVFKAGTGLTPGADAAAHRASA